MAMSSMRWATGSSANMGASTPDTCSSASIHSGRSAAASRAAYPKSDIQLNLKDHYRHKVYTSSSPIKGDLTITTKREVRFDSIQIVLLGQTKTCFESMGMPQEVTHTFLKLIMPVPESTYPVPRILEPGRTYTIPFNFVIPNQLTINACNHARLSDRLQDHHVLLPPSLGSWDRDDLAPKMAQVEYTIKGRVLREHAVGGKSTRIMEATEQIRVLPATPEEPPLNITEKDTLYRMSKTKTLRKNLLGSKLGRLTAEAIQPSAAVLSSDGRRVMSHPMAHIKLTFEPDSPRTLPPAVTGVSAKLTAHTYFSAGTISTFPNLGDWNTPHVVDRRGQFFASVSLPPVTLAEQPAWTPVAQDLPPIARRDSGYCSSDAEQSGGSRSSSDRAPSSPSKSKSKSSSKSKSKSKSTSRNPTTATSSSSSSSTPLLSPSAQQHTTTLTIPLALPTDKNTLVPTFHSCIASRVYSLHLTVNLRQHSARGAAAASNTLTLVVPLQIAVEGSALASPLLSMGGVEAPVYQEFQHGIPAAGGVAGGALELPSFEEAEADEHLRPRVLQVPRAEYLAAAQEGRASWMMAPSVWESHQVPQVVVSGGGGGGDDGLPGYGELGFQRGG